MSCTTREVSGLRLGLGISVVFDPEDDRALVGKLLDDDGISTRL